MKSFPNASKKIVVLLVLLSMALSLFSCEFLPSDAPAQNEEAPPYTLVYAHEDEIIPADEFSLSDLKLVSKDDPSKKISVTLSMIGQEDYDRLSEAGVFTLTVHYESTAYTVKIMLREPTGKPISDDPTDDPGDDPTDDPGDDPSILTQETIVKTVAYALKAGETTEESYTLTGAISSVHYAYSSQYNNVSVVITVGDLTDYPIECFRLAGSGVDKIGVGDTITVTGKFTNFDREGKSVIEFIEGCTLDAYTLKKTDSGDSGDGGNTSGGNKDNDVVFDDAALAKYYKNASGKTGSDLKLALRTIISDMKTLTYSQLNTVLQTTDAGDTAGKVRLFYTGVEVKAAWDGGSTWNKEHVWPQSQGWFTKSGAGSDAHHLRPCDPTVNSKRGNLPYGTGSGYYEPADNYKGDCARIIFYLLTRYSESDSYSITKVAKSMDMLLEWNKLDPVDSYEIQRNNEVYKIQGNRNPFIDCPEYADLIWAK